MGKKSSENFLDFIVGREKVALCKKIRIVIHVEETASSDGRLPVKFALVE